MALTTDVNDRAGARINRGSENLPSTFGEG